jgi:hypothetical protein
MKYQLKLNLSKCTFGVKSRKLLGFVMSDGGIEVDPDNVKAIQTVVTQFWPIGFLIEFYRV